MWIAIVVIGVLCLLTGALSIKLWFDVRALRNVLAQKPKNHPITVAMKIVDHEKRLKAIETRCS